jgi:hypothetical protein
MEVCHQIKQETTRKLEDFFFAHWWKSLQERG